jgi:hypothetical protein
VSNVAVCKWRIAAVFLLAVVATGGIALVSVRVAPDVPVSGQLTPHLEAARDLARSSLGLAGPFPARLVEARCSEDGRAADLTFESGLASIRSFATIGFPSPDDWYMPGATTVIVGSGQPAMDVARSVACDLVEIGPPG